MATKCASLMMIFTVNIVRDGATNRYELGARRNRYKPATRNNHLQYLRQRDPRLAAQKALFFIKGDKTSQMTDVDCNASFVKAAITIAPSIRKREHSFLKLCQTRQPDPPIHWST